MTLPAFRPRLVALLFAAAQLVVPAAVGVADAMAADNAREAQSHVETTTCKQCASAHLDDCAICRHLTTSALKSAPPPLPTARSGSFRLPVSLELSPRSVAILRLHSRAPPVLQG